MSTLTLDPPVAPTESTATATTATMTVLSEPVTTTTTTATIGQRVQLHRKRAGLTLRRLAREAGVAPGYLSQIEHDKSTNPSMQVVAALATVLGVTPADLGFGPPAPLPISRCRHFGVQWTDPLNQHAIVCVTCGERFPVLVGGGGEATP